MRDISNFNFCIIIQKNQDRHQSFDVAHGRYMDADHDGKVSFQDFKDFLSVASTVSSTPAVFMWMPKGTARRAARRTCGKTVIEGQRGDGGGSVLRDSWGDVRAAARAVARAVWERNKGQSGDGGGILGIGRR